MDTIKPVVTFRTGFAASRFAICLSGAMDAFDPTEPYSRLYMLNQRAPHLWAFNQHDFVVPAICTWRDPATPDLRVFAALGENGEVVLLSLQQVQERIPGAGLQPEFSKGYGYLNDIQQIGGHLYACGYSGQVYRRNGAGDWAHMDEGILQAPGPDTGQYFAAAINGPHERAIYVAGSLNSRGNPPRADFWNGDHWSPLTLPATAGRITNIFVESEDRIWICGAQGTLLLGNAAEGFRTMNPLGARQLFLSVTKFQDQLYLGSNLGLFRFDPVKPNALFRAVRSSLRPGIQDANIAAAADDVLWSMGPKDILRYDGVKWERFNHPDNPPLGTTESEAAH
jgi:hypothetical protein